MTTPDHALQRKRRALWYASPRTSGVLLLLCCATFSAQSAEVRVSFLQDANSLKDTLDLLIQCGCTHEGTAVFKRAVQSYYSEPFEPNLSRFPIATNGFYTFGSPQALISAYFERLDHSPGFNCADAIVALAERHLRTVSKPDDPIGPIWVSLPQSTNGLTAAEATTLR